jgi:hypothetical protein
MSQSVAIDTRDITVTPVFKFVELENVPKSEAAGHLVKELKEVVEVRFAGENRYSPVFPANAFWKREGNNVITYAERWSEQYRKFKEGSSQEAYGTPLEMLRQYGVTPEQLSLCRTMKVYSIEALHALEGTNLKNLGMNANKLKELAAKYIADRSGGTEAINRIQELERQLAELRSKSTVVPEKEAEPEEIENVLSDADMALIGAMTDEEIRAYIFERTGAKPDGRLGRDKLENMARSL